MTDRADIQNVLGQMRSIREQMQVPRPPGPQPLQGPSFEQQMQQVRNQSGPVRPEAELNLPQPQTPGGINELDGMPPMGHVPSFGEMFKSAVDTVNDTQMAASEIATRYEQGDPEVDLPEVMIALQKSSVSFQAMTQVRNKMVEAYKDIMNMPI
ncbi:flagellar hook-basal body complex protein FliE [Saccharospirillum sp. HFRX-1]|uniref:flagellar hook-basal body complex protein FliE n=1 Tax=unclassified Saccharospirillum TaxID=2633430 RepID=UPI003724B3D0